MRGFEGTPGNIIPRYVGNAKHEWRIGETTDDTERTVAVARAIISERHVSHVRIGQEMLGCRKCVHPGVKSLWEFHHVGDPARIATRHDGCGAAVRVAPVGIFYAPDALEALVNGAREASISTHGGSLAIAGSSDSRSGVLGYLGALRRGDPENCRMGSGVCREPLPSDSAPSLAHAIRAAHDDLAALPVG